MTRRLTTACCVALTLAAMLFACQSASAQSVAGKKNDLTVKLPNLDTTPKLDIRQLLAGQIRQEAQTLKNSLAADKFKISKGDKSVMIAVLTKIITEADAVLSGIKSTSPAASKGVALATLRLDALTKDARAQANAIGNQEMIQATNRMAAAAEQLKKTI